MPCMRLTACKFSTSFCTENNSYVAEGGYHYTIQHGVTYHYCEGVPQDYTQAIFWHQKSAEQGFTPAQFNLGIMYLEGQGVAQDYAQTVFWYLKAAEQGNAYAQNNLGEMYRKGLGVAKDEAQALDWFRKAAAQGDTDAQKALRNNPLHKPNQMG